MSGANGACRDVPGELEVHEASSRIERAGLRCLLKEEEEEEEPGR